MKSINDILPELTGFERSIIEGLLKELDNRQAILFADIYRNQRKSSEKAMILSLLGFIFIAGLHRFYLDDSSKGILFLFSFGLFFIGTIYDIGNIENLTYECNRKIALKVFNQIKNA